MTKFERLDMVKKINDLERYYYHALSSVSIYRYQSKKHVNDRAKWVLFRYRFTFLDDDDDQIVTEINEYGEILTTEVYDHGEILNLDTDTELVDRALEQRLDFLYEFEDNEF